MIAEQLPNVLRNHMEAMQSFNCIREESFSDMYAMLGDAPAQEQIRQRTSGKNHCRLLQAGANACECLPYDVADAKAGQVCPNNPIMKYAAVYDMERQYADVIAHANELEDLISFGALPPLTEISPEEYTFARIVYGFMRQRDQLAQQAGTLGTVAKLFGGGR